MDFQLFPFQVYSDTRRLSDRDMLHYRQFSDITVIMYYRPSNSSQPQQPCSGRGECVCGVCETCDCLPGQTSDKQSCRRFTGKYCQCNPDNCPRNSLGICSSRGKCTCDEDTAVHTCQCEEGYTGTECDCQISQETCKDPSNTEDPDVSIAVL